jgi:hypothetical protein
MNDEGKIPVTDPVAQRMLRDLRASIAAEKAARLRYEASWRGRLAARGWWPDGNGWAWAALFAVLVISMLACAYAGYLEATAPLPSDTP